MTKAYTKFISDNWTLKYTPGSTGSLGNKSGLY